MPYATVSLVKELGGLQAADDYNLFRFTAPDELDAAITRKIAVASAWLRSQIPVAYASVDADTVTLLTEGEAYMTLHYLLSPVKARRVYGTHWPLDQEGSDRFAELIDVEWKALAQDLLGDFLTIAPEANAFARPTFNIGPVIDRLTDLNLDSESTQLQKLVDEAAGGVFERPVVTP